MSISVQHAPSITIEEARSMPGFRSRVSLVCNKDSELLKNLPPSASLDAFAGSDAWKAALDIALAAGSGISNTIKAQAAVFRRFPGIIRSWSPADPGNWTEHQAGVVFSHVFGQGRGRATATTIKGEGDESVKDYVDLLSNDRMFVAVWNASAAEAGIINMKDMKDMKDPERHLLGILDVTHDFQAIRRAWHLDLKAQRAGYYKLAHYGEPRALPRLKEFVEKIACFVAEAAARKPQRDEISRLSHLNVTEYVEFGSGGIGKFATGPQHLQRYVAGNCPLVFIPYDVRPVAPNGFRGKWRAWQDVDESRPREPNPRPGNAYAPWSGEAANWLLVDQLLAIAPEAPAGIEIRNASGSPAGNHEYDYAGDFFDPRRDNHDDARRLAGIFGRAPAQRAALDAASAAGKHAARINEAYKERRASADALDKAERARCSAVSAVVEGISRLCLANEGSLGRHKDANNNAIMLDGPIGLLG